MKPRRFGGPAVRALASRCPIQPERPVLDSPFSKIEETVGGLLMMTVIRSHKPEGAVRMKFNFAVEDAGAREIAAFPLSNPAAGQKVSLRAGRGRNG